jgi:hypothetical protein
MTNETKRGRSTPKGTTKDDKDKGAMVWIPAELKNAVLAYIEFLKQQQELES